ncbi:Glycine cleavage system H protein [compost metagenome]
MVFVQLPELQAYAKGEEVAVLESVKAASNIVMPLDGEVVEVNQQLTDSPELANEDPLGKGWFFRMQLADTSVLDGLLDQAGYENLLKANG